MRHAYLGSHSRAEGGKGTYPSLILVPRSDPCMGSCCCSRCLGWQVAEIGGREQGNPTKVVFLNQYTRIANESKNVKKNAHLIVKRKCNIGWPGLGMPSHGAGSLLVLLAVLATNAVALVLQQLQRVAAL